MRVVIAEDDLLTRVGLEQIVVGLGHTVIGAVGSAEELLALVSAVGSGDQPDVAVIDIRMPPAHTNEGLACAATLGVARPELPVLVLSHHLDPSFASCSSSAEKWGGAGIC